MTRIWLSCLLAILLLAPAVGATVQPLPAKLELRYAFAFDGWTIGRIIKTLQRGADGAYRDTMTAQTVGLARLLSDVKLADHGVFRVSHDHVRPLSYVAIRKGDRKGYRRQATFHWRQHKLLLSTGHSVALHGGMQDDETVFYAFMLHPLQSGIRQVTVTNGASLTHYRFEFLGQEQIKTPAGTFQTLKILRLSSSEAKAARRCQALSGPQAVRCNRRFTHFVIWVAPRLHDIAIKLRKDTGGRVLTITLTRDQLTP